MGTISKRHQGELDRIADKAVTAWNWAIGEDFNPDILDEELLGEGYQSVFEAITDDLDELAERVGTVGHSESYLRGSLFPKIWITLRDRGVFYDFEFDSDLGELCGDLHLATCRDLSRRLLRRKTVAARSYREWNNNNRSQRVTKRKAKNHERVAWNQSIVDEFNELAIEGMENPQGKAKEQLGEMMVGLQWFVGRRPWAELGLRADFQIVGGPDWADGWLLFSGHAKQTQDEKDGLISEHRWEIPLFGITAERFMKSFRRFRELQEMEPWFNPSAKDPHVLVRDALGYSTNKVLDHGFAAEAMAPVFEAGYNYKLTMHRFRDLYVSRGHAYHSAWCKANGKSWGDQASWASKYLGHFGDASEQDTGEYLRLEFFGSDPIPTIS